MKVRKRKPEDGRQEGKRMKDKGAKTEAGKIKDRKNKKGIQEAEDYSIYRFSRKEWVSGTFLYCCLDGVISYLFFESWLAWMLLLPGIFLFWKEQRQMGKRKRERMMQAQFMTGMQMVCTSLQAGYAVENAFKEALGELEKMYEPDAFVIREFQAIVSRVGLNQSIEALLLDLGQRTQVEDICNFAEVFYTAKRTGGDLLAIVRNTVSCIQQKQETRMEIETSLSGKVMEQNMMSGIPVFILGYVRLTSPDFLEVMYHSGIGIAVMSICLGVYLAAYLWGKKIMDIQV